MLQIIFYLVLFVCFFIAGLYDCLDQLAIVILFVINILMYRRIKNIEETITEWEADDDDEEDEDED